MDKQPVTRNWQRYLRKLNLARRRAIRAAEAGIATALGHLRRPALELPPPELNTDLTRQLSFCISYRNRFEHITRTLPVNLEDNRPQAEDIEFVIVQFGGEEDLYPWLVEHYSKDLDSGYIKFYTSDQMQDWHMSIAKNTALRLGTGRFVVSLDCDNFTGPRGGQFVIDSLTPLPDQSLVWQWNGLEGDGTCGRISLAKNLFLALGGYDEELTATAHEDYDLINRAKSQGIKIVRQQNERYARAIAHEYGLGLPFSADELRWQRWKNRSRSMANILNANVRANADKKMLGVHADRMASGLVD